MRKPSIVGAVSFAAALILLAVSPMFASVALANPIVYQPPTTTIISPAQSEKYGAQDISLNVNVHLYGYTYVSIEQVKNLNYSLDGAQAQNLAPKYPNQYAPGYDVTATATLTGLSIEVHNVTILGETTFGTSLNATVTFEVNTQSASSAGDSWVTKAMLPFTGVNGAVALNGKIYVIGFSNQPLYEYDPQVDSWTLKTYLPTHRTYFAMAACENKIYIIGGITGTKPSGESITSSINEAYDPAADRWETKAPMPTNRSSIKANVVNGKIYVMGGRTASQYSTVNKTEAYDPATDSWTTKQPMIYSVTSFASAALDEKIYVFGGQDEFDPRMNLQETQIYDTTTDKWSLGRPAPVSHLSASAGATTGQSAPKRIYIVGGSESFAVGTNQNFVYNPQADAWSNGSSMPSARYSPSVAVVNDLLYVMGGSQGMSSTPVNEQYTPIGYGAADSSSDPPKPPSPSQSPSPSPSPTPTQKPTESPKSSSSTNETPASSPTPTASIPEFPTWLAFMIVLASTLLIVSRKRILKKRSPR